MKIIEIEEKPIYVVADIHGDFDYFKKGINENMLSDCIIIVAGDCGFGFYREPYYNRVLTSINNHLIDRNIQCFMIRGNHDDPSYFNDSQIWFSNVKAISDYTILKIGRHNILCVGGAVSVDRKMRIDNYWKKIDHYAITMNVPLEEAKSKFLPTYWDDEMPYFDITSLKEIGDSDINIDIVVSHTSPSFAFKTDKKGINYWLKLDDTLGDTLKEERGVLDSIYNQLVEDCHSLKKWVYGHFHEHNNEMINGIEFTALMNCDFNFDIKELNAYDL